MEHDPYLRSRRFELFELLQVVVSFAAISPRSKFRPEEFTRSLRRALYVVVISIDIDEQREKL